MKTIIEKAYLTEIPHEGGELSFHYPAFKGEYRHVASRIDSAGAKRPSSAETASLAYEAWTLPEKKDCSEIISILDYKWLWEFTGNLYLPKSNEEVNNGVILETNPKMNKYGSLRMDKNSLVQRLKENDPLVKFVPFGFKIGGQSLTQLQNNPYIIARYGKEGAEKIKGIASKYISKYKNLPYLKIFKSVISERTEMSGLGECYGFRHLHIFADFFGYGGQSGLRGHAFGVKK